MRPSSTASSTVGPAASTRPDLAFVACIEPGVLEDQALLLFDSIRRFGGPYASAPIYAYSPRVGRDVSPSGLRDLSRLDVVHIDDKINGHGLAYGTVNRIVAGAHAERTFGHDALCVIDSDTIFLDAPLAFADIESVDMLARPVDGKGRVSAGPGDPNDHYLQRLCELAGVAYEAVPLVKTTVGDMPVKASYNGGLVVVRTAAGILQRTEEIFLAGVADDLIIRPNAPEIRTGTGVVSSEQSSWWGSSQIALSLAAWGATRNIRELAPTYNYPLHAHAALSDDLKRSVWHRVIHLHYHWLLQVAPDPASPLLQAGSPLSEPQIEWLAATTRLTEHLRPPL